MIERRAEVEFKAFQKRIAHRLTATVGLAEPQNGVPNKRGRRRAHDKELVTSEVSPLLANASV